MTHSALSKKPKSQPAQKEDSANLWSEYEIEATVSLVERALRTLKHGDTFSVTDSYGDIGTVKDTAEGLFYRDTRFLSHLQLRIEGKRPILLSSTVHEDKAALSVDLTNPDITYGEHDKLRRDTIFMARTQFLWDAACHERLLIKNYGSKKRRLRLDLLFDADFHDLFEVRGTHRDRRGTMVSEVRAPDLVEFRYTGLDKIQRKTIIHFTPAPKRLEKNRADIEIALEPGEQTSIFVAIKCGVDEADACGEFFRSYRDTRRERRADTADIATVTSSNDLFDEVVSRASSDVYTLLTRTEFGRYPYAGVPWFNTIFGRDGIITAMLMLWMDPSIAKGVLRTLAATQADRIDPKSEAQPGKILHEMRHGEMANLGEVPFGRYYGTVDATPLFVMLAGMYFDRTGDKETISGIWPNIEAALRWIDEYGDRDGDGFIEYDRETENGLANQGWKDSHDAIFHADGSGAEGAIALCEAQAYVYAAKQHAARMANQLGFKPLAPKLLEQAEQLRRDFESAFWCEELGTYAIALDGRKQPCCVCTSNAGHALFAGIAAPDRAKQVAAHLMNRESFSGWGIRTVASCERRYNPMSYHNGSVWPHDNALIAMGFGRYGLKRQAASIFKAMFDAARQQELRRLPELFCGFTRHPHRGPIPYPVACSPQAWAASSTFGLLGACLGLEIAQQENEMRFRDPAMPDFLEEVGLHNLRLGTSRIDMRLHRYGRDVTANVLARKGPAKIVVLK